MSDDAPASFNERFGQVEQVGRATKIHSTMDKEVLKVHHTKEIVNEAVNKTVTNQITSSDKPSPSGGDVSGQLSGMLAQVQALAGAGVGLPGIQDIGSQISGMGGAITGGGGSAAMASTITGIGTSMASAPMSAMSGLAAQLSAQMPALAAMMNPAGGMAQVTHSQILDKVKGIAQSAFDGKHTVALGQGGIAMQSAAKIAATAPSLPHNGTVLNSNNVMTTGSSFASAFPITSDAKLKSNIHDHPSVLDDIMSLKLKCFHIREVDWENEIEHETEPRESIGLIAQEVQEVFPMLVHGDKFLCIEESKIGLLLLAAFQEFVAEVRSDIAELKGKNDA